MLDYLHHSHQLQLELLFHLKFLEKRPLPIHQRNHDHLVFLLRFGLSFLRHLRLRWLRALVKV